jgi:hypothetical protein
VVRKCVVGEDSARYDVTAHCGYRPFVSFSRM